MALNTYSFLDVNASISGPGGNFQLGQGAGVDKEGITINFNGEKNAMDVGADGNPVMSLRANLSGTVSVKLQKTSPTNQMLALMYNTQKQSSALWAQNTIVVADVQRGDLYSCTNVAFKKFPDNVFGEDAKMVEWVFDCGIIEPSLGTGAPSL